MLWLPLALLTAFLLALTGTLSKAALSSVSTTFVFVAQSLIVAVFAFLIGIFNGGFREDIAGLQPKQMGYIFAASIVVIGSTYTQFAALAAGNASRVQPVVGLSLVFAIVLATLFLKEKINTGVIAGAALMVVGAIIIAIAGGNEK